MDIDTTEFGQIQNALRQDLAECSDNDEIRSKLVKLLDELFIASAFGLEDGQVRLQGQFLDRRRREFQSAAFRAIRLRDNGDDLEIRAAKQSLQARTSQFRRAHENDSECAHG